MKKGWMIGLFVAFMFGLGGCDFSVDSPEKDCVGGQCGTADIVEPEDVMALEDSVELPDTPALPDVPASEDVTPEDLPIPEDLPAPEDSSEEEVTLPDVVEEETITPPDVVVQECIVSGCSAQVCAPEPVDTDCEWLEEYGCLKLSECGPFGPDGGCAWLETEEYLECLEGICTPEPEVCDEIDNDCDGEIDEGCNEACTTAEDCSDGDDCTLDYCKEGICISEWDPNCGECVGEGETGSGFVPWPAPTCCDGLDALEMASYDPETGMCMVAMDVFICSDCGNGTCEKDWENFCNCPEDCKPAPGCIENIDCDDDDPCTDDVCKEGKCYNSPIADCIEEGCWLDEMCPDGSYCRFPDTACDNAKSGTCTAIPEGCFDVFAPVCGCDGKTYGNECEMQAASQSMAHEGACEEAPDDCGGIMGLPCLDGQYCQMPPGTCDWADMMGSCVDVPWACPAVYQPVCGCDGKTYGNECEMAAAMVSLDHEGVCKSGSKCEKIDPAGYGMCLAIIGVGYDGQDCVWVSGCGCGNDCDKFFDSVEECKAACL